MATYNNPWGRGRTALAGVLLWAGTAGITGAAPAPALAAELPRLVLDATLNEPVVLRLEVACADESAGLLDLRAEGIHIQREVRAVPGRGVEFFIEPDTSRVAGSIHAHINVVDRTGAVWCGVPVVGQVRPCVRVSPAQAFLGGLEYGTAHGRVWEKRFRLSARGEWKILGVDATEVPGADSEITAPDGGSKELVVRFAEDALKAGQPFGAFIKREVRVRTDIAAQPEVSIPIEAMLSINRTPRDFHTYVFRGNERWQGRWSTPNVAAAVLAPPVLLLLGWGALAVGKPTAGSSSRRARWLWRLLAAAFLAASAGGMVLLAWTYSRGGWTAFGAGLAAMLVGMRGQRRILAAGAAVFLAAVLLLPAGAERFASSGSVKADKSISHRLLVWRGALEMIADHPWRGVGAGRFGEVFRRYYQEPWHKDDYTTALNDYLTCACERGLPVALLVLFLGAGVLGASLRGARTRGGGGAWYVPAAGAWLAAGVSPAFSSVAENWEVWLPTAAAGGMLAVDGGVRMWRARHTPGGAGWNARRWKSAAVAGVAAASVLAVGVGWAALGRSARPVMGQPRNGALNLAPCLEYVSGWRVPPRGTILYLPGREEGLDEAGRRVLRPLAENGWRALALSTPEYDQDAARLVSRVLHELGPAVRLLSGGAKARVAVAVATARTGDSPVPPPLLVEPALFSALAQCDQSRSSAPFVLLPPAAWLDLRAGQAGGFRRLAEAAPGSLSP